MSIPTEHDHPCPHRPQCDGCPLFEYDRGAMYARKRSHFALLEALPETSSLLPIPPIVEAPRRQGWRWRARMTVDPGATHPHDVLGFYLSSSRVMIGVSHCMAHHPGLERALGALRRALLRTPSGRALLPLIRFVDARFGAHLDDAHMSAVMITLCLGDVAQERRGEHLGAASSLGAHLDGVVGEEMVISLHLDEGTRGAAIGSGALVPCFGATSILLPSPRSKERGYEVGPKSFFQVNPPQLRALHGQMQEWLEGEQVVERVTDLYCGVGVHGIEIASHHGARLLGIDVVEDAIERAHRNAERGGLSHALFHAGAVEHASEWLFEQWGEHQTDVMVINPARAGLTSEVVRSIGKARPKALVYLSCHALTLSRDLVKLARLGMRAMACLGVDMMPDTNQLEVMVLLRPGEVFQDRCGEGAYGLRGEPKRWSEGVSGLPEGEEGRSIWRAWVEGRAPVRGELPSEPGAGRIVSRRLATVGRHAVVHLVCDGLEDDHELRRRLRGWGHPVIGDEMFGRRGTTRWAKRNHGLDRVALHCLGAQESESLSLPSELLVCTPIKEIVYVRSPKP